MREMAYDAVRLRERILELLDADWRKLTAIALRVDQDVFTSDIMRRKAKLGLRGAMSRFDAAFLYALVAHFKPRTVVEVGTHIGMSASFILKAMLDSGIKDGRLYSVEATPSGITGVMIPDDLRDGFHLVSGDILELAVRDRLPDTIDFFLHDSTHRYSHQLWEFQTFWLRLSPGGILASHDVNLNASFVDFVSATYAHDSNGKTIKATTEHKSWGRVGLIGFAIRA
jgi:predicted O-methyltransferase YrrM